MKTIAIFALVFLVACDTINPVCHNSVTVSPANPVQFWPVDCQTFNEKEVCGIYHRCYCQPWQCDDEIRLQGYSTDGGNYDLQVLSEEGTVIDQLNFSLLEDLSANMAGDLDSYENEAGSGAVWTTGDQPTVTIPLIGSSRRLSKAINLKAGNYQVTYTVTFSADTTSVLRFYKSGSLVESVTLHISGFDTSPHTATKEFTLDDNIDTVTFLATNGNPGSARTVTINSAEFVKLTYVYSVSFVPSDLGICDEKIQLKIINTTTSPDEEELRSDCLDIRTEHECTNLIEYGNNRNYAGLIYTDVSPSPTFLIRVRSIFYEEEFPQEDFVMELNSGIEKTSSVITSQRLFEVDRIPSYMHKKLILIFEHQSVLIDDVYWTKQEKYEMTANDRRTTAMRKGQVLLTMRDFVQRSVL
jgi:hypothetical protein